MINPTTFHEIVSGRRKDLEARFYRCALRMIETPYAMAVRWRNRRYDAGRAESVRVGVPVVCVGNMTLGGVGKTPMVAWIARKLRERNIRVSVVSRGYGAEAGAANDEAKELEIKLPDVPHLQNPNRAAAAQIAVEELATQLILLDDGFQHRRLARDFDVVLIDAWEPFGFDHVFPRGTLREPLAGLARAQAVVLTRADQISAEERNAIRERIKKYAPNAVWAETCAAPQAWAAADGSTSPLAELSGKRTAAFCGIGNPAGFRKTLESLGVEPVAFREFPDHHPYGRDDLDALSDLVEKSQAEAIVCTEKDLVKIGLASINGRPLRALRIAVEFLSGQTEFETALESILEKIPADDPEAWD